MGALSAYEAGGVAHCIYEAGERGGDQGQTAAGPTDHDEAEAAVCQGRGEAPQAVEPLRG